MDWGQCFIHHRLSMPIKQVSLKSSLHKRYYLGNQRDMQQEATPKILPSAPKGYRMFFSETNKKDMFQTLPHARMTLISTSLVSIHCSQSPHLSFDTDEDNFFNNQGLVYLWFISLLHTIIMIS